MKIPHTVGPPVVPLQTRPDATTQQPHTHSKQEAIKHDQAIMKGLMKQWFAKAGINLAKPGTIEQSPGKRLKRHQQLKAERKLHNLERIFELSLDYCLSQGQHADVDADWFFSFIEMAERVYSPVMQDLWAKIFAVEISKPGSFSVRSLQMLKALTQKDAQQIKTAASMTSIRRGDVSPRIVTGFQHSPGLINLIGRPRHFQLQLSQFGLTYTDILSLMDMGILYTTEIESSVCEEAHKIVFRYGNQSFQIVARKPRLTLKYYKFTSSGAELYKLFQGQLNQGYFDALTSLLREGFDVT